MNEYRRKFIETAAPLDLVSENILLAYFINGLKEDIKAAVRLLNLITLEQAMELAMRVEEKHRVSGLRRPMVRTIKTGAYSVFSKEDIRGSYSSTRPPTSPVSAAKSWASGLTESQGSVYSPKTSSYNGGANKQVEEIKRLTEKELMDRKAKGL